MIITLNISAQDKSVLVDAQYRWWVPGADPWTCRLPGYLGSNSGTWYYVPFSFSLAFNGRTPDAENAVILFFRNLPWKDESPPFEVGQTGIAHHNVFGKLIPGGDVNWEVLSMV
jgi:hypothetical protein